MSMSIWQSSGLYEHPERHSMSLWGFIVLMKSGKYYLDISTRYLECPQKWAADTHKKEIKESL